MSLWFLLVLGFAFGLEPSPLGWPARTAERVLATVAGVVCVASFAWWLSTWTVRRLQRRFDIRARIIDQYYWLRWVHSFLGLGVYVLILQHAGWKALIDYQWGLADWLLIDEILLLAPFLLAECLSLACFYCVEDLVRRRSVAMGQPAKGSPTRWHYLNFQLRTQMGIWLAASLLITGLRDLAAIFLPGWADIPSLAVLATGLMSLSVLALSPAIIRFVWQAAPLPKGPMRTALESTSRRLGFRYSNILVWRTGSGVVNAAVTGLFPQLRYVLLSDALLEQLTPAEVQAVFGHEVGHIRHHHMTYYFGFVIVSVVLVSMLAHPVGATIHWAVGQPVSDWLVSVTLLLPYFAVMFGFLSRRFERQADLFGSRVASQAIADQRPVASMIELLLPVEPETDGGRSRPGTSRAATQGKGSLPIAAEGAQVFIESLEKVAVLNGISRKMWNWRHGSIAKRVEFLEKISSNPALADRFDRSIRRLRWAIAIVLVAGILLLTPLA